MNFAGQIFTLYVGRLFLVRFLALLIFFVLILQMLDLLNRSEDILSAEGAGISSVWRYISLRAPQIASQFTPFAALLGIVFTLAGLSHTSEITIMRAAGMSIHRVLFPLGFTCALIALSHFVFHETVTVPASEKLDYWAFNEYAVDLPPESDTRTGVRISYDGEFIRSASAARIGEDVLLTDVTIYSVDSSGLITNIIEARNARYHEGGWRLFGARTLGALSLEVSNSESVIWTNTLDPELLFALTLEPDQTSIRELVAKVRQLSQDRADTRSAMTSLLSRFSKPLATLVMPLLGAIAGFGVHRQGVLLVRAVTGAALGFGYFVAENLALALGSLGVVPAIIGAFFPIALFMVVGFSIILAMEN
ncbi:LPS export ABC transporter permease LptG [Hyphococcus flavus]|uniref:LPS export ABC transporter permease LptG n=1 Tax=Hyphococcus flavus TaxID=1866326 RepID=A0AAE9ZH10_9PROT|nr:LPS export ABC transporter permease LptG [Hyphococcus flavus]WDI32883.1 LPS export ABC transporter permease LptG [Hyphococcus flavus]